MKITTFINNIRAGYLWCNLMAMGIVFIAIIIGLQIWMNSYTHHGETIIVPDVRKLSYNDAVAKLQTFGLEAQVIDTGYIQNLPPHTILNMTPAAGCEVKGGHTIYLTINANNSPTIPLPDLIDNCSLREAQARLIAMGFKLQEPQYVTGEKDWVYGIIANGMSVTAGQRIGKDAILTLQVGNGKLSSEDSVYTFDNPITSGEYSDSNNSGNNSNTEGDVDNFEVVE